MPAAYEIPGFSWSLPSAADYSAAAAGQFRFVDVNASGNAVAATAAGGLVGVRQNNPRLGEAMTIVSAGVVFVEASAAIALGAIVEIALNGKAVTRTAGIMVGRCLSASSADGQFISVLLFGPKSA